MALQGQFLHSDCIYLLMHGNTSNRLETEINILYVYGRIKDMLEKKGGGGYRAPWFLTEVSGDHFCAACHFLSGWRV